MTPRSLFTVILKIFGLFFLKDVIESIPQLISAFIFLFSARLGSDEISMFVIPLLVTGFYAFMSYQLLFRTSKILDILKLDKEFDADAFSFTISLASILTISLIVIGGMILTDQIPNLCRYLYTYYQQRHMLDNSWEQLSYAVFAAIKILIALLLIRERRRIVAFIESRQNKTID